jgi:hypothetical protein
MTTLRNLRAVAVAGLLVSLLSVIGGGAVVGLLSGSNADTNPVIISSGQALLFNGLLQAAEWTVVLIAVRNLLAGK